MKPMLIVASLLAASCTMAAERGEIAVSRAGDIPSQCDSVIATFKQKSSALEKLAIAESNVDTLLKPWNIALGDLNDYEGTISLLANVHTDAAVRSAYEACDLKISALFNDVLQSHDLYVRLKAIKPADEIDAETLKGILLDFENKGVNLPAAKRKKAADFFTRLDKLQQDFQRNVRENKQKRSFSESQLKGIPAELLKTYQRDDKGNVLVGFDYPEYLPLIENAEDGDVRKQMYTAYQRRGGEKNLAILREVVEIRKQLATLLGYKSFAAWVAHGSMVEKPEVVLGFLSKVKQTVTAAEKAEIAQLTAEKVKHTGQPNAKLERWDLYFYESKLKKSQYQVDQAEVRAQFPTDATVNWLLAVTSKLYGVEFRLNPNLPTWHADVKAYDVFDAQSKAYLSSFYLDLFPRDGKYKHAAAFTVRQVSTIEGRTPVSALVTNFNRDGFDQEELETVFHEFGHVMHGVLSRTRYTFNAGTATKRDFVEAPSQMYEEWSRNPASLKLWNEVCPTCKPIDGKLIERLNASRTFGQGTKYARQWLYAAWDMALHGPLPKDPQQLWVKMEGATPLGHVPQTEFPGTFGHVVGGYAAGYYGYMWSEVLALDMRSAFKGNMMDLEVGRRFRQTVLENGSQVPEMKLVERFLGRKPNSDAFFREITGRMNAPVGDAKP